MTKTNPLNLMDRSRRKISGPERDRTADLLNANQALSQLSYRPKGMLRFDGQERFEVKEQTGLWSLAPPC